MQIKNVIINADDFGYSEEVNEAVLQSWQAGNLTAASLMTNMEGYDSAVFKIYPQIRNIDLGFHFNIVEGKSLSGSKLLCNSSGYFNNDFVQILYKSNNKNFLEAVETEFRQQLEKALKDVPVSHIDSHRHIHAIPKIYDLISKLAREYNIQTIRTQREIPYIAFPEILNLKIPANIVKNILLNYLTGVNCPKNRNNYVIGVLYTGLMDEKAIIEGLKAVSDENAEIEIIMHPSVNEAQKSNYRQFLTLKNPELKQKIQDLGFKLSKLN